jgi:multidrug resistance efflux pump
MRRRIIILAVIAIMVIGGGIYGANMWYQNTHYVTTSNAQLNAPLISVSTMGTGQMVKLNVDIGKWVEQGQSVAEVTAPRFSDNIARQGSEAPPSSGTAVEAPVSGYVAAVWTYPGALISAGSPVVTIYDASSVWVTANIDEGAVSRVHPGQDVEISVDSLGGMVLKGKVQGISPATAATFSLLPQSNTNANFIKVGQVVPVKIIVEKPDGVSLIPGSSVEVKIATE